MLNKKVQADHSDEHQQGIGAPVLGEADVVGHKSQGKNARKGDGRRKLSGKNVDHRNGKDSKDQRNNTEIPFRFWKGIKLMGENIKKRRVKVCWVLFIES
jgi:hypothetical protein